jgi:hypothetical protein
MASNKVLTAQVLTVTATPLNEEIEENGEYTFTVHEFSNGLILVPGDTTNDWFFGSRDEIEPCGTDRVIAVEDSGKRKVWTAAELLGSIQGSIREFGVDSVPAKHLQLWK